MTANLVVAGLSITHHEGAFGWHAGAALAYGQPRLEPLLPVALVAGAAALSLLRPGPAGGAGVSRGG